jgi:flagellar protein FliS
MNGTSVLRTYRSVSTQSAAVDSNPHQLVLMLIDGAIEKTAGAVGHMLHGNIAEKGKLVSASISIIDALRASLDHRAGGEIADNLERLYDYMTRRLLEGNAQGDSRALSEVIALLKEIREAWAAIPQDYRRGVAAPAATPSQSPTRQ